MKDEEKVVFLKAVLSMATVDDDVDLAEMKFFSRLSDLLGLNGMEIANIQADVLKGKETTEDYLEGIKERGTKLQLLYEMVSIASSDDNYDEAEHKKIREAANTLGIETGKLEEIEKLVSEEMELLKKKERILEY